MRANESERIHTPLRELLIREKGFRRDFIGSLFCDRTSVYDIVTRPLETWKELSAAPGFGEKSLSRLRRFLVEFLSAEFGETWDSIYNSKQLAQVCEDGRLNSLRLFIEVWNVKPGKVPLSGWYYPCTENLLEHTLEKINASKTPFVFFCDSIPTYPEAYESSSVGGDYFFSAHNQTLYFFQLVASATQPLDGGIVIFDEFILECIRDSVGIYKGLSVENRLKLINFLRDFSRKYDKIDVFVCSFKENGFSSGFQFGDGVLYHEFLGGYLKIDSPDVGQEFLHSANHAKSLGMRLNDWFSVNNLNHDFVHFNV